MKRQSLFEEIMPVSKTTTEVIKTGLWGKLKPLYEEGTGPCREACPLGTDIPLFISYIKQGDLLRAKETILFENPFPSVCGRVCAQFCYENCNRAEYDSGVSIRALERFLGDTIYCHIPISYNKNPKRIAIVGSGPAGLSCAYFLLRLGHEVIIFEKENGLGGLLKKGIPSYRLPKDVVQREVQMVINLNPEVHLGKTIEKDHVYSLLESFDYVFLSPGLWEAKRLDIKGADKKGIYYGFDFLRSIQLVENDAKRAIIIGGGDVAMDAARTIKRLKSTMNISIFAPEDINALPALKENIEETLEEGIDIIGGYLPVLFEGSKRLESIYFQETKVIKDIQTGELTFITEGKTIEELSDIAIICIGQKVENRMFNKEIFTEKGFISVDKKGRTKKERLYAGGDITGQRASVSDALASGKKAAIFIDMDAKGLEVPFEEFSIGTKNSISFKKYLALEKKNIKKVIGFSQLNTLVLEKEPQVLIKKEPSDKRIYDFREVAHTLTEDAAKKEADRCLSCGQCKGCDLCYYLCPDVSVIRKKDGLYGVNNEYCKSCGICAKTCPSHIIEMVEKDD